MSTLLVFLQNAYRKNGRAYSSRDVWLRGLWGSHTGRRLVEMLPDEVEVYVENASPRIGDKPDALYEADLDHILRVIESVNPTLILACGKIAQQGLDNLGITYVPAPHPAWRLLSKEHTSKIKAQLMTALSKGT